jgi:hypothetical protein
MRESTQLLQLRGRMAAWDRSFCEGHGRHPNEYEWAAAARVVGHLPADEAERLAHATYSTYGEAAASAPAREDFAQFAEDFTDFAETLVARQERRRAAAERAEESAAFRRAAAPLVIAGLALAVWAARQGRGKLAA